MREMSKFWREHLAEAQDTYNMGEHVGLLHGLLMEGDERITELEGELKGTVTTKYHDSIVAEAMRLVADTRNERDALVDAVRIYLSDDSRAARDNLIAALAEQDT